MSTSVTLFPIFTLGDKLSNFPQDVIVIMAALCNRAGHYIFALWFLSSVFFPFFPRLISAAAGWMSIIRYYFISNSQTSRIINQYL